MNNAISIHPLSAENIPTITQAFKAIGWNKPAKLFEKYLAEEKDGKRLTLIACLNNKFAGYVTLQWFSLYEPFRAKNISEIMDLNVLSTFRKQGIGSLLLDIAEQEAATKNDTVGIGVGLYAGDDGGYGPAQRLYVKRGYIPDGKGVTYNYLPVIPGKEYPIDDNLILWLTKKLK